MRRLFILALLVGAFVVAGGTDASPASAAEGDSDDYCSHSPDYPFGWSFNEACEGHDSCLFALPSNAPVEDRLGCDDLFFDDLLGSAHLDLEAACEESQFCQFLATLYYRVVRWVTLLTHGGGEFPAPAGPPSVG